jgi:hypothetical protein
MPRNNFLQLMSLGICICLIALINAGCATIIKGSSEDIKINSTPAAAKVVIKSTGGAQVFEGTTPTTAKLSKRNEYLVTISLENYKDANVNIIKDGIEGWFWGNILCGGLIGIIVDAADGAINDLSPDEISVTLLTAYNPQNQKQTLYAVFQAYDNEGNLRHMLYPMESLSQ